ncbi:PhoH family protein [gut metagenome]|uniref:PhoH family protein n=1 Tax=gut metagenome TaxID=749906 RepID=J9D9A7_9ZZZZ
MTQTNTIKDVPLQETLRFSADAGNAELAALCGPLDENLRQIETIVGVRIRRRGDLFTVTGEQEAAQRTVTALSTLLTRVKTSGETLNIDDIQWHFVVTMTNIVVPDEQRATCRMWS